MGGFSLTVELHREGSAPAACAADYHQTVVDDFIKSKDINDSREGQLQTGLSPSSLYCHARMNP